MMRRQFVPGIGHFSAAFYCVLKVQRAATMLFAAALAMLCLLAAPCMAEAQQSNKIPRLCFLTFDPGSLQTRSPRFDEFFQGLQDLGYVDGRTINISYLSADNNGDRFPALIDECLKLKPDVVAVTTTPAAHLLKRATSYGPDRHGRSW
jgi:putative ABC transport system substrate-binding protein